MALNRQKRDSPRRSGAGIGTLVRLGVEEEYRTRLPDGRELTLMRRGTELRTTVSAPPPDGTPGEEDITILESDTAPTIRPVLPDLPLVLQPESEFRIMPGAVIRTAIALPLGIGLTDGDEEPPRLIREYPAVALSKTWFGTPDSGEAAYSWKTSLSSRPLPEETAPWEAACPLVVRNDSPEILDFKRMILRVPGLSLYSDGRATVTDAVTVRYRGQTQVSQVSVGSRSGGPPGGFRMLTGPRTPVDKALLRRSFAFIKTIYTG